MNIIKHSKKFFTVGILLVAISLVAIVAFGIPLGIQFTGGTALEISFEDRPPIEVVEESLAEFGLANQATVRPTGENNYFIRTPFLEEEGARADLLASLEEATGGEVEVERVSSIGPSVGAQLAQKAIIALAVVILAIIAYIAWTFRRVSEPVASWKYGVISIVAMLHDVLIVVGLFALLGQVAGVHINVLFVIALLTILGYSVNDTIVVFDRTRENLALNEEHDNHETFPRVVGRSLYETFVRSALTGVSVLLVLLALMILGTESTFYFSLALVVGIIAGTYSSLFLASPLLVQVKEWQEE